MRDATPLSKTLRHWHTAWRNRAPCRHHGVSRTSCTEYVLTAVYSPDNYVDILLSHWFIFAQSTIRLLSPLRDRTTELCNPPFTENQCCGSPAKFVKLGTIVNVPLSASRQIGVWKLCISPTAYTAEFQLSSVLKGPLRDIPDRLLTRGFRKARNFTFFYNDFCVCFF